MTQTSIRVVIASENRLFRKTICCFLIDRVFSNKTGSFFLSSWFFIFCRSALAIAGNGNRPDNAENTTGYSLKDDSLTVNEPTVITPAPGVYVIPKVGYYYMDDTTSRDQAYQ